MVTTNKRAENATMNRSFTRSSNNGHTNMQDNESMSTVSMLNDYMIALNRK